MSATWIVETGTSPDDGCVISEYANAPAAAVGFLTLASFLNAAMGILDAWIDMDIATVHTVDGRWVTMTADPEVSNTELDDVMDQIRPFIESHQAKWEGLAS